MTAVAAVVPMRHESERVPGKNYRPFNGRPLFCRIIETLLACPELSVVAVDTDSPVILDHLEEYYPQVVRIERPEHLRSGDIPMNEVLLHDLGQLDAEVILQTHSTNPLLRPATVSRAVETFLGARPACDSLFGVTRVQVRLWDQLCRPINHNPAILLRTQDLPPVFAENSCLYVFTRRVLIRTRNRIGARPLMFEIPRLEAWDIDEELDFHVAEFLHRRLNESGGPV